MPSRQIAPTHLQCSLLWISSLPDNWKHFISLSTITHSSLSFSQSLVDRWTEKAFKVFLMPSINGLPVEHQTSSTGLPFTTNGLTKVLSVCSLWDFFPNSYKILCFLFISCSTIPVSWAVQIQLSDISHDVTPFLLFQGPNSYFLVTLTIVSCFLPFTSPPSETGPATRSFHMLCQKIGICTF